MTSYIIRRLGIGVITLLLITFWLHALQGRHLDRPAADRLGIVIGTVTSRLPSSSRPKTGEAATRVVT